MIPSRAERLRRAAEIRRAVTLRQGPPAPREPWRHKMTAAQRSRILDAEFAAQEAAAAFQDEAEFAAIDRARARDVAGVDDEQDT